MIDDRLNSGLAIIVFKSDIKSSVVKDYRP